jgi:hypothetical protein
MRRLRDDGKKIGGQEQTPECRFVYIFSGRVHLSWLSVTQHRGDQGVFLREGVQLKSLTKSIHTGSASGRFFFRAMAILAEMDWDLTVQRTRSGLEVARQRGPKRGRNG